MTRSILLLTGGANHDFVGSSSRIAEAIAPYNIETVDTEDPLALTELGSGKFAAVVVFTEGNVLRSPQVEVIGNFVANGGGLVAIHSAISGSPDVQAWQELLGLRFEEGAGMMDVAATPMSDHPIMQRVQPFTVRDELYKLRPADDATVILQTYLNIQPMPLGVVRTEGKGRVVALANGHYVDVFEQPEFANVLTRSIRWAVGDDWSKKTIRCASIGYGGAFNMGKKHLETCKEALLEPVAVCDVDPARVAVAKEELGEHIQTYTDVGTMLAKSDVELCILITPHNTHAPLALQCLEAGRHVVCEKPFTITIDEATQVINTAAKNNLMASVFHNRRWDGDFTAIQQVIRSGAIGEVFKIECFMGGFGAPRLNWWRSSKAISGGALYDWGAHFTDWVLNLMPQKIASVSGVFHKLKWHATDNEDHTEAHIRFENGATASLEQSSVAAVGKARWRILGTEGAIEAVGGRGVDTFRLVSMKDGVKFDGAVPYNKGDWSGYYRNVADHLVLGEPLIITAEQARKVIAVIELAEKSAKAGGIPMPVPFEQ